MLHACVLKLVRRRFVQHLSPGVPESAVIADNPRASALIAGHKRFANPLLIGIFQRGRARLSASFGAKYRKEPHEPQLAKCALSAQPAQWRRATSLIPYPRTWGYEKNQGGACLPGDDWPPGLCPGGCERRKRGRHSAAMRPHSLTIHFKVRSAIRSRARGTSSLTNASRAGEEPEQLDALDRTGGAGSAIENKRR